MNESQLYRLIRAILHAGYVAAGVQPDDELIGPVADRIASVRGCPRCRGWAEEAKARIGGMTCDRCGEEYSGRPRCWKCGGWGRKYKPRRQGVLRHRLTYEEEICERCGGSGSRP